MPSHTTTVSQAAHRLHLRYQRALDLVLCGELEGEQDDRGRWQVSAESVERWEQAHRPTTATAA